jgi:hypothetical protein
MGPAHPAPLGSSHTLANQRCFCDVQPRLERRRIHSRSSRPCELPCTGGSFVPPGVRASPVHVSTGSPPNCSPVLAVSTYRVPLIDVGCRDGGHMPPSHKINVPVNWACTGAVSHRIQLTFPPRKGNGGLSSAKAGHAVDLDTILIARFVCWVATKHKDSTAVSHYSEGRTVCAVSSNSCSKNSQPEDEHMTYILHTIKRTVLK